MLVQAILTLDEAHTTQQSVLKLTPPPSQPPKVDSTTSFQNVKTALDRLSKLYILLFGPPSSEDAHNFTNWISQNRELLQQFLGDRSKSDIDDFPPKDGASCGVVEVVQGTDADSPPQPCDILLPYQPALKLSHELKLFRKLAEWRFASIAGGIPRAVVAKVAALEILYHLVRDQTTDCVWNVDHQATRIEVFTPSDVGKVFRDKCACPAAEKGAEVVHSKDVHCPKNKKDEDSRSYVSYSIQPMLTCD